MPNHCTNRVTITAPKKLLEAVRTKLATGASAFDFNAIVPMPETLQVTSGSRSSDALAVARFQNGDAKELTRILDLEWVKKEGITTPEALVAKLIERDAQSQAARAERRAKGEKDPWNDENPIELTDLVEFGNLLLRNIEMYGCPTWYDWAIKNWGTKWPAYELEEEHTRSELRYRFYTAWSPPAPVFDALVEQFPGIGITNDWEEEGGCNGFDEYGNAAGLRRYRKA